MNKFFLGNWESAQEGEFEITLETNATKLLHSFISKIHTNQPIRFTFIENNINISVWGVTGFAEVLLKPLEINYNDDLENKSFYIDNGRLDKLVNAFPQDTIDLKGNLKTRVLEVMGGKTYLTFDLADGTEFINYSKSIERKDVLWENLDGNLIKKAISYLEGFCKEEKDYDILDTFEDFFITGNPSSVGMFYSENIPDIKFNVGKATLPILNKMLDFFDLDVMKLYNTERYYIFQDGVFCFGFLKSVKELAHPNKFIEIYNERTNSVKLNKEMLIQSLNKLGVVITGTGGLVRFSIDKNSVVELSVEDLMGRESKDILENVVMEEFLDEPFEQISYLKYSDLSRILRAGESNIVEFSFTSKDIKGGGENPPLFIIEDIDYILLACVVTFTESYAKNLIRQLN